MNLSSLKSSSRTSPSPRESKELSVSSVSFTDSSEPSKQSPEMPSSAFSPSRPLTVAIPTGEPFRQSAYYCPRRPNLADILANNSPPPWTLTAFMAYLSQNHCLETLEFTMDAKRYRQHYEKTMSKSSLPQMMPGSEDSLYMLGLWQRLMQAYIQPNGAREVNLPSEVRDALLSQDLTLVPPHPDSLDAATEKVHELMEESVLVPFLNSHYPQMSLPESNGSSVEDLTMSSSYDERGLFRTRTGRKIRRRRSPHSSSPPLSVSTPNAGFPLQEQSAPPLPSNPHRASAPSAISQFGRTLSQSVRQGFQSHSTTSSQSPSRPLSTLSQGLALSNHPQMHHTSSAPQPVLHHPSPTHTSISGDSPTLMQTSEDYYNSYASPSATDDDSNAAGALEPMTPPTTPPIGDLRSRMSASPVSANRQSANPWKRMRYSFGWRKKSDNEHDFPGDGH